MTLCPAPGSANPHRSGTVEHLRCRHLTVPIVELGS